MSTPNSTADQPEPSQTTFDFGTLSHSTLPDLSLINQPKLTLDLGTTDLSVSLDELNKKQDSTEHANQLTPASSQPNEQAFPSELERNRSRRWTSLSELGRAVLKPSVSNLRQLGSLNERSAGQQRTAGHSGRRLSEASGTPSIYSSYRANRNIFKLFSHEPPIESSPPGSPGSSPSAAKFPTLPPMSELLDGSASFNQQDLSSITQPISLAHQLDPVSDPTPALKPLPPSPLQSPSLSAHSEPLSEPGFASAVQSPTVLEPQALPPSRALVDSPSPRTPSLKSCQSSPVVPTIDRVLSQAGDDTASRTDLPKEVASVAPKEVNSVGPQPVPSVAVKGAPEDPTASKLTVSPVIEPKTDSHPVTTTSVNHSHLSKTNLAGILSRKKKSLPGGTGSGPASTGSGSTSFFKLFLLKGLGLKHHHSPPTPPAPGRPSSSSTASSPTVA